MCQSESEKIARMWVDSLNKGDYQTAMSCIADDIEWVNIQAVQGVSDIIPWIGTAHGKEEVLNAFSLRDQAIELKLFKPTGLIVQGDQACCTIHEISVVKATGLSFEITFATWMQITNGKILKWKSFCDPSPIIAAFRGSLSERLIAAVEKDDIEAAKILLKQGANPNARNSQTGLNPLMTASCHANLEMVKLLLEYGADVFTIDSKTGATPLHKACQGGSLEVVTELVEAGAFVDAITPTMGHSPVMDALWYKWPDIVKFLIKQNCNLQFGTHYGFTLDDHVNYELNVNQGEEKRKFVLIQEMIEQARWDNQKKIESQKVMEATNKGDVKAVKKLIGDGEDVNTVYPHINSFLDGHTPLLVATRDGHAQIASELLKAGAKVRVEDWVFKGAPIHKATYNGNPEILKMLVQHPDIDLDVQGPINGYTPLHDALWHGFEECARILIDAGARLDLLGHDGKTVLDLAREVLGPEHSITQLIESKLSGKEMEE